MDRRRFFNVIVCGLFAGPLMVWAQQPSKIPRIGYLLPNTTRISTEAYWAGLREFGYVEGRNIIADRRYADGRPERYPELATELVRLRVDVIVADGAQATLAARQSTSAIPIVMVAANPVGLGLISSLGRPGGNVTGLSTNSPDLMGKRLELLREAVPNVSRVAVMANSLNPASALFLEEAGRAAKSLGFEMQSAPVHGMDDFDVAFSAITHARPDALLVIEDPTVVSPNIVRIVQFANKQRLPTIAAVPEYAGAGILMTYGPNFAAMYRRTAFYVDRILKGAKPAELPVEEPTRFELIINLKTAKALGLTVPQALLLRAGEVIR